MDGTLVPVGMRPRFTPFLKWICGPVNPASDFRFLPLGVSHAAVKEPRTLARSSFTRVCRDSVDHSFGKDGFLITESQKEFTHLTFRNFE